MNKVSIIYFSQTGHTKKVAKEIELGIKSENENIIVKQFSLDNIDNNFLEESSAVIFGTPTIYSNISWQLKKWFDESKKINLEGKIGGAFATANYVQGGADIALQSIINHMLVKGMLVYSGGSSLGKPYTHLGPIAIVSEIDDSKEMFRIFGIRIAKKLKILFG